MACRIKELAEYILANHNEKSNVWKQVNAVMNPMSNIKNEALHSKNKIQEKFTFASKEISNPNNLKAFYQVGKYCQIPTKELGFPLFWTGEKCLMGDQPIIDYLKEKTDTK